MFKRGPAQTEYAIQLIRVDNILSMHDRIAPNFIISYKLLDVHFNNNSYYDFDLQYCNEI